MKQNSICKRIVAYAHLLFALLGFVFLQTSYATDSGEVMEYPPIPKLEKPVLLLGPAGELFNFVSCQKGKVAFTMAESTVPPGMGPPPHIHHYTNEWFYAANGGILLYTSDTEYDSTDKPPDAAKGTLGTVYLIPMQPKKVVYGPKYRIHGFNNTTSEVKPLTFIWKADPVSPPFKYNDGGIREFFEACALPVDDPNNLPAITDETRGRFLKEAAKYGISQSFYFLQYINRVEREMPATMQHSNMEELNEIVDIVREYNTGSKEVTCR